MDKAKIRVRMGRYGKELRYALHLVVRPFSGFWDLKRERRGSLPTALTIVTLVAVVALMSYQFSGYFFMNPFEREFGMDLRREVVGVYLPFFLWVAANWGFTTLMDGEGSMKDVAIATGYALTPLILVNLPVLLVSNLMTLEETEFLSVLQSVGVVWTGFLIFVSVVVTHQYTIPKALVTIVLSIAGMAVLLFVALLFVSLLQQMVTFFVQLYTEAGLRWIQ